MPNMDWPDSDYTFSASQRRLVSTGSSKFLNLLLLSSLLLHAFHFKRLKSNRLQPYQVIPGPNIRRFGFKELQEATNGFKEELGRGSYSTVYKGIVKNDNIENVIAVKKLHKMAPDGEQEFKAEVSSISRTNHKNLVQLLGYCDEGQNRLLVYEFMSNGSLLNFLFQSARPNWYKRLQIAFATARGESFTAKISDFGIAKLLKPDQSRTTTGIRGTKGYVAPAIWCIQEDPALRPTMKRVVQLMEGSVEVPIPPDPASFVTSI
ncbi:receptor-like protein kinase 1 [Abeliophyllum distichum]|uniref:non-specific serine/threonine protein kinase n=1 Tax=Abeliophyllum distichum TaxID=126358 RepID=A0ABD1NS32_9LAMI